MQEITINEVLKATNGILLSGNTDQTINSVCIDTRNLTKGCLFVPLKGENSDGHNYIKDAFNNGAAVSLIEQGYENNFAGSLIQVKNTLQALQDLASYYREKFTLPVIAVTGSVGKTTTKEMIAAAFESTLNVLKTEGNYNGQIGLPLSIFNLEKSHQVAIFEMGISKPGEMDKLTKIAKPDIAVITNIGLSHIENFGSIQKTCEEKSKIIGNTVKRLYINADSPLLSKIESNCEIVKFGINGVYPYKCEDICSSNTDTTFVLSSPTLRENIKIPCLGIHNVYDSLAAIAVAMDMNIHIEDIKNGLLNFKNANMRQQILNIGDIILIDDSYNASPDSVKSSVSIIKNFKSPGKNIVVIADMLELGNRSEEIHFSTGRYIAMEKVDILITVGTKSKFLSDAAKSSNQSLTTFHFEDNNAAIEKLKDIILPGDKILIKGSRGMHADEISNFIKKQYNK